MFSKLLIQQLALCAVVLVAAGCGGGQAPEPIASPAESLVKAEISGPAPWLTSMDEKTDLISMWKEAAKIGGGVIAVPYVEQPDTSPSKAAAVQKEKPNLWTNPQSSAASTRYFVGFGSRPRGSPSPTGGGSPTGHAVVFFISCSERLCAEEIVGFTLEEEGIRFINELTASVRAIRDVLYVEVNEATFLAAKSRKDDRQLSVAWIPALADCLSYLKTVAETVGLRTPSRILNPFPTQYLEALRSENNTQPLTQEVNGNFSRWSFGANRGQRSDNPRYIIKVLHGDYVFRLTKRSGTLDPYLIIENSAGTVVAENDDFGNSLDSQISVRLSAGEYTLVTTGFRNGQTGEFTLTTTGDVISIVQANFSGTVGTPVIGGAGAIQYRAILDRWVNSVGNTIYGQGVKRFRFDVTHAGPVNLQLTSSNNSATDPYLIILGADFNQLCSVCFDDDSGGSRNAVLTRTLEPGTYYAVAGTFTVGESGSFQLVGSGYMTDFEASSEVIAAPPVTGGGIKNVDGRWSLSNGQVSLGLGTPRYSFTVPREGLVEINLRSSLVDPFLYLLSGGTVIAFNDDISASDRNSRISIRLAPGSYTIAAATYRAMQSGAFTLSIAGETGGLAWSGGGR